MAGPEWFYGKDNKQHGPISGAELKQLAQSGHLKPIDLVWREGMEEWMAASKVKGLFDEAPPSPPQAPPAAAAPPGPVAPQAAPPPAASGPRAEAFSQPHSPEAPVERRPSVHVLDATLQYVRAQFSERFIESANKLFTLAGHYGLYGAMALVVAFGLLAGVKTSQFSAVFGAVGWAVALAVFQYAAIRFFKALEELNRSTTGTLGSSAVPDCFALLAMIFGILALLGLAVGALQMGMFVLMLPAVALFILCQYLAIVAVNHQSLNITIDPDARAGEEALGVVSFVIKVWLRLVPVAFGVGIACGILMLVVASGLLFISPSPDGAMAINVTNVAEPPSFPGFDMEMPSEPSTLAVAPALAVASMANTVLGISAALPLLAYLAFIFAHLGIDVTRAVLAVPGKLDLLREVKSEE